MTKHNDLWRAVVATALFMGVGLSAGAASGAEEMMTPEQLALTGRMAQPAQGDLDQAANLGTLLAKKEKGDWSQKKGAVVEGYVVRVWKSPDGDRHLILAGKPGETDQGKWVVGEVKPAWQKKVPAFADAKLDALLGKKVQMTGWLFFDTKNPPPSPHGTPWEVHPITGITLQP